MPALGTKPPTPDTFEIIDGIRSPTYPELIASLLRPLEGPISLDTLVD